MTDANSIHREQGIDRLRKVFDAAEIQPDDKLHTSRLLSATPYE
jgi:hypothetical protein